MGAVDGIEGARRIRVVGTSGSGKTTLAAQLAQRLGVPHVELDALFHGPGWTEPAPGELARRVDEQIAAAPDGWVMCGNYLSQMPIDRARPDLVVWLDLPHRTVMRQVLGRTLARLLLRRELWNGNREHPSTLWARDGIVRWAWRTHPTNRARYAAMSTSAPPPRWVRLRSRREVAAWLGSVGSAPASR